MNQTVISEPACSPDSPLSEREYDKLLTLMGDGRVVPVIGPEMLCVPWENDPAAQLYDVWGKALAHERDLEDLPETSDTPLLYSVANRLSLHQRLIPGDLEYEMDGIIRGQRWPLPESLRLLAEITDFPLYVTTTIDHLMVTALRQMGADRGTPLQVVFQPGGKTATCDLPRDFTPGERPTVFQLFGATSTDPDGFAATEDSLIEYSWALLDKEYAPKLLFDFLRKKTILLLGCDFPDWLGRFFVHALTRQQDAKIAVIFVSGCSLCGLHEFLQRKNARLFTPFSPLVFVQELHKRWQQRQHTAPNGPGDVPEAVPSHSKRGAVFISYAKEDHQAASIIRSQLEEANIDTWMDESELESGMEFEYVIKDNIERASFFIPLISRAHDLHQSERLGRFVLGEWHWAEKVNEQRLKDDCYLRPVVVDNTPPGAAFIERPFRDLHWTSLENGKLPPEFIDSLRRGIRRYRSSSPGGAL